MKVTRYKLYYKLDDNKYLLINTLTGAIDVVEENVIKYLLGMENKSSDLVLDDDIIVNLQKRGYLIDDDNDKKLLNRMVNFYEDANNMLSFTICPTYSCNLRCPYCFENKNVKKEEEVLTKDQIDKVFEAIHKIVDKKKVEKKKIQLFGGEPFQDITQKAVRYIFSKAKEIGATVVAITNGTNLELFKDILNENKELIHYLQITLDGPEELHNKSRVYANGEGSFCKITNNIKLLLDMGINVVVRVNIGKKNIKHLPELFDFFEKESWINYDNFVCQLTPITDHRSTGKVANWLPENEILKEINTIFKDIEHMCKKYKVVLGTDMERRIKLIRSIWNKTNNVKLSINPSACGAGSRIYYVFGADGKIYPCPETVGETEYSIGTFLPEFSIDQKKDRLWKRNVTNISECINCNIAPLCGSSCVWSSIATNGIQFKKPVCNYAKETINDYFNINKNRIANILRKDF